MKIKLLAAFFIFVPLSALARDPKVFFLEGDGKIPLVNAKTGQGGQVVYREPDGSYPSAPYQEISRIFGAPAGPGGIEEGMSSRLIALLDHLQDHFHGGNIRILSGYRSPTYNENLRKKGKLAAKTSLHIEGMAADIEMDGVDGKTLWEYVRSLDCCGAGFYHGKGIHLDTGPSRFWDETSTKVEQDLGARNKLILLRTEQDIYYAGDQVRMVLARVTDYPIGVRSVASLLKSEKEGEKKVGTLYLGPEEKTCMPIKNRKQARSLSWIMAEKVSEEWTRGDKLKVRIFFCDKLFPEMPDQTDSNPIVILAE